MLYAEFSNGLSMMCLWVMAIARGVDLEGFHVELSKMVGLKGEGGACCVKVIGIFWQDFFIAEVGIPIYYFFLQIATFFWFTDDEDAERAVDRRNFWSVQMWAEIFPQLCSFKLQFQVFFWEEMGSLPKNMNIGISAFHFLFGTKNVKTCL